MATVTCPAGHASASDDFCDVCGIRIGAAPAFQVAPPVADAAAVTAAGAGPVTAAPAQACPRCGISRAGQFCEACGYDYAAGGQGPSPAPAVPVPEDTWTAVVTADRGYFERVIAASGPEAAGIAFPAYCPERRFPMAGAEVRIGRASAHRGIDPEIDLTGPPADPGVSRLHAVLLRSAGGTWSVVDPGSENGTRVNGTEIPAGQPVPLRDGDLINLGAWTALTITREA